MKLGLNDHMIIASGGYSDPIELLDVVNNLGLKGVHYSTLNAFQSISPAYLSEIKEKADALGLYIEVGMGACNPYSDCRAGRDANRDPRESLRELISVASALGSPVVRTFFGYIKERFFKHVTLKEQIDATVKVLNDVKDIAKEHNVKIALENHLELTTYELLELIRAVDSGYVGICFDSGNPLILLEDPVEACERLLPHICTTHIKDGIIYSTDEGARWAGVALGEGFVALPPIFRLIYEAHPEVNLNIEDLWDVFLIPFFDRDFMASLKHLDVLRMVEFMKLLRESDTMIRDGKFAYLKELSGPERCKIIKDRVPHNIRNAKAILKRLNII